MTPAPHLLIVEDNPDIGATLQMALEPQWRVTLCMSGREALAALRTQRPAVVLLDLMLPDCDGSQLAAQFAALGCSDLPIVVLSAAPDLQRRAEALGASAWLRKPFDIGELEAKLASLAARPCGV